MEQFKVKNILYMGSYQRNYPRNDIFIKSLIINKVNVYEYNINSNNPLKNLILFLKNFKRFKKNKFDLILFHSPIVIQFYLAKLFSKLNKIPLVNDIFVSKLLTNYYDRKKYKKYKIPKFIFKFGLFIIDLIECKLSDHIILDTYSHIKYFYETFNISINKFKRIFVGSNDKIFKPIENVDKLKNKFLIGFWGTYIPLQGISYIIKAAKILENNKEIEFLLLGNGQTFRNDKDLARKLMIKNIKFIDKLVPIEKLPEFISKCNITLGIFGNTLKAKLVIPNKVFNGISMKIPVITQNSSAIKELFTHNKDIILCESANPESLAESILTLYNNHELMIKIQENAYKLYKQKCSIEILGLELFNYLSKIKKINLIRYYKSEVIDK